MIMRKRKGGIDREMKWMRNGLILETSVRSNFSRMTVLLLQLMSQHSNRLDSQHNNQQHLSNILCRHYHDMEKGVWLRRPPTPPWTWGKHLYKTSKCEEHLLQGGAKQTWNTVLSVNHCMHNTLIVCFINTCLHARAHIHKQIEHVWHS